MKQNQPSSLVADDDYPSAASQTALPNGFPPYIFGLHERGGQQHMLRAGRPGWVLELAAIGLDGANTPADFSDLSSAGLGVIVRINHGYGSSGTIPTPDRYPDFAAACARYVARSKGCRIWVVGNEPNHRDERPNGHAILPTDYARAYTLCRNAIRNVPGHADDLVLVAGPAPWNATTTYPGNEKGDWVRYFVDIMALLSADGCDGFALHTYTHFLEPRLITGDFFHTTPGYRHLRNEFRTYRDFMNAIPDRFRSLPVILTETDPTTRGVGWNPGHNVGWVRAAYREIADWNRDPAHQPIQGLLLYRWPLIPDQPEWSIVDRPGIIEDFNQALRSAPASDFAVRMPIAQDAPTVLPPGKLLGEPWQGLVVSPLGLNLRSGPTTQHAVLQILPNETTVTVLGELDDWLYVRALERTGYVSAAFILLHDLGAPAPDPAGDFLRHRPELWESRLAPPAIESIRLNVERATWTERVVARTWNDFGALVTSLADTLRIDPAIAVAVLAVESGGRAFGTDGRMLLRFEAHIFFEEWGKLDPERFAQHFRFNLVHPWQDHQWRPAPDQAWRTYHGNQAAEWEVFTFARDRLSAAAAVRSISMGAPQIMGFNHATIGYGDAQAMFNAFANSAHAQVIGFFDFVNAAPTRLTALREGDYLAFATSYNGSGQAPLYAALIQDAMQAFTRLREREDDVLRDASGARLPLPPVGSSLAEQDPELYQAWRAHILDGFTHNKQMFEQLVDAFMGPYRTTVLLYRLTFGVGLALFIAAVALSAYTGELLFGLLFGGLGAAAFLSFFVSRPLRALEENLNLITWLGVIYNTYWTRMVYAVNLETVQEDLAKITDDFVRQIDQLLEKSRALHRERPGPQ